MTNEKKIRHATLLALWDDETHDIRQFNAGDMNDAEAAAKIDFWQQAADLYKQRASDMRGTAQFFRHGLVKRQRRRERLAQTNGDDHSIGVKDVKGDIDRDKRKRDAGSARRRRRAADTARWRSRQRRGMALFTLEAGPHEYDLAVSLWRAKGNPSLQQGCGQCGAGQAATACPRCPTA
jgi:hypothetical protein